jgi:hypothetical protein
LKILKRRKNLQRAINQISIRIIILIIFFVDFLNEIFEMSQKKFFNQGLDSLLLCSFAANNKPHGNHQKLFDCHRDLKLKINFKTSKNKFKNL